nr:MAG TPA: hypothetical protein [Caudoviricetes sp.]
MSSLQILVLDNKSKRAYRTSCYLVYADVAKMIRLEYAMMVRR